MSPRSLIQMFPKFGVVLPPLSSYWTWTEQIALCRRLDRLRASSIWVRDDMGSDRMDPFTILSALAEVTHTTKLVAEVTVGEGLVTQRHPALLAKAATSLDVLSHGRAMVVLRAPLKMPISTSSTLKSPGVPVSGSKWMKEAEENATIMKIMFEAGHGRDGSFRGKNWSIDQAVNLPRPMQLKGPPILVEMAVAAEVNEPEINLALYDGLLITSGCCRDLEGLHQYIINLRKYMRHISVVPGVTTEVEKKIVLYGVPLVIDSSSNKESSSESTGRLSGEQYVRAAEAVTGESQGSLLPAGETVMSILDLAAVYESVGVDAVVCVLDNSTDPKTLKALLDWLASE